MDVDAAPRAEFPTGDELFGGMGMSWKTFDEYEVPFDPMLAIDGDG